MSDDEVIVPEALPEPVADELEMYKDYLRYMPVQELAKKYKLSPEGVYKIAAKNEWKRKRAKAKVEAYKNIDKRFKEQIADIVKFIQKDLMRLMQTCTLENREMTMSERGYLLSLLEKFTKETRLNDGKPTDISDNNHVIRHEVLLPPGVEHFGVIPPASNVTQITAVVEQPQEPTPEEKIEFDDDET